MRNLYFLLFFIILLPANTTTAQDLINSRRSSYYTFIYKISDQEAANIYRKEYPAIGESYFHSFTDMYPADSCYHKTLPVGHYLFVSSIEGNLQTRIESVNNVEMKILTNERDLMLVFNDSLGNEIHEGLAVHAGHRKMPFRKKPRAFVLQKSNHRGMIRVAYGNHTSYFEIDRAYNNSFAIRSGKKIISTFPINHIVSPVKYLYTSAHSLIEYRHISPPGIYYRVKKIFRPKLHKGYVAFNKPMYKPGDTVKLKAYITSLKGKPVDKAATVILSGYAATYTTKTMGKANHYRKGGYTFEFVLNDSLKFRTDQSLIVTLERKPNKSLLKESFRYEDYKFGQNNYSARSERTAPNKPGILYLKGSDSNGLPLYDVTAEILVTPGATEQFFKKNVFIPDTLWRHTLTLDLVGETKVVLPDSIFPTISFSYTVNVFFRNADNELQKKKLDLTYNSNPLPLKFDLVNDSITITALAGIKEIPDHVLLTVHGESHEVLLKKNVNIPCNLKLIPAAVSYTVHYNKQNQTFNLQEADALVSTSAYRTHDSLFVTIVNPRKLRVRYQLFHGNHLLEENNSSAAIQLKTKSHAVGNYSLAVQYIWAGKGTYDNYDIPFNSRDLTIKINSPQQVYPGQEAAFTIQVKDTAGEPVADADITAYAITKKFGSTHTPNVPLYRSKRSNGRMLINRFTEQNPEAIHKRILDWPYWKKTLGLDSIAFYHFLYPQNGYYMFYTPAEDSITQFAPFVVQKGDVIPVHVIYVNNVPVYYSDADIFQPYSFQTRAGECKITLRIRNKEIVLKNIRLNKGMKLIFSVDLDNLPSYASVSTRPYRFTDEEKKKLSRYFIMVNKETQADAFLQQRNRYYLLPPGSNGGLVGPFNLEKTNFVAHNSFETTFSYEPFYSYEFSEGLLKMRNTNIENRLFASYRGSSLPSFKDQALTRKHIDAYWKRLEQLNVIQFKKYPVIANQSAGGTLKIAENYSRPDTLLRAVFIVNLQQPDQYYIFPNNQDLGSLPAGHYQVVLIYNNEKYIKADSIIIKNHGLNYYNLPDYLIHKPDTFSTTVMNTVKKWANEQVFYAPAQEMHNIRHLYYKEANEDNPYAHWVTGCILDHNQNPIPGVNVIIKGTAYGTVTDINGCYGIHCPEDGTLVFSFIGYISQEVNINNESQVSTQLSEDYSSLQEVVVVGYGYYSNNYANTGSITRVGADALAKQPYANPLAALLGRMPGVVIQQATGAPGGDFRIQIRGQNSLGGNTEPLFIVDGIPMRSEDFKLDSTDVSAIDVLKNEDAAAIYGSRGANGVIIISTKLGMTSEKLRANPPKLPELPLAGSGPGSSLRKNFRDYAFWQPTLRTDEHGIATFKATFPDDITGWQTYALGMASKKRSGQNSTLVQAYKPLAAQLALPDFLVAGDSSTAIGKITNYTADTLQINHALTINNNTVFSQALNLDKSTIDSLHLAATSTDSLAVKYTLKYNDYEDGELRKIPVLRQGVEEATGLFMALPRDTTFTIPAGKPGEKLTLYAEADLLDVLLNELTYLRHYPYSCNEQIASRLNGLLIEKKICAFKKQTFNGNAEIRKLINKLVKNQNKDGSWGWWGMSDGKRWVTRHVVTTLEQAKQEKYAVDYDREGMINYMASTLVESNGEDRLQNLIFLTMLGEKTDAHAEADSVMKHKKATRYEKLLAQKLLSTAGLEPDWHWINAQKQETLKGNFYWGDDQENLFNNDITNTLLAYQIIEKHDPTDTSLLNIRNFFLEKRQQHWRNTYESSLILETLLPALLRDVKNNVAPSLKISGATDLVVKEFPFTTTLPADKSITIQKSGSSPLYFTAYQQAWNTTPQRVDKDLIITTYFDTKTNKLKAGKPVVLTVELDVKKDASYVMIQVPVPAGCSYQSKENSYAQGEVYREHYNHQTNIYCESLRKGKYTYHIKLVPRFKGSYHLNPATVEWMYFPTVFGREEMKRISITEQGH